MVKGVMSYSCYLSDRLGGSPKAMHELVGTIQFQLEGIYGNILPSSGIDPPT